MKPNRVIREDAQEIAAEMRRLLQPLEGSTLLITGGSGFLFSYLLDVIAFLNDEVFAKPCRVISVDNLRSGVPERVQRLTVREDFRFIDHDVSKPLSLGEPVDRIIHGAGIASPIMYRKYPLETIDVNVGGTRNMLELAREGVASILHLSTSEIYGDPDAQHIPTREDYRGYVSCTGPRACYDESKRLSETLCVLYHQLYRVPVKVVRPFNVYGPGQNLADGRIIPDLMSAAIARKPLTLLSDGRATRAYCYIRDFMRGLIHVLVSDANGDAFNVGNDSAETTVRQLAEIMQDVAGEPKLSIEFKTSSDAHYLTDNPQRRCPDLTKVRTAFGYAPKVSLREGLSRTLESYRLDAKAAHAN